MDFFILIIEFSIFYFCIASFYGHKNVVDILLSNGANIHEKYYNGFTALHFGILFK